jgi:superoxide dismutase, Fe-Mn family
MIALQGAIRFNGGGHINHSIFWENLAPAGKGGGGEPTGDLKAAIDSRFGSFAELKKQMNAAGAGVQGSGWVWLGCNKAAGGRLDILTCANQDPVATVP